MLDLKFTPIEQELKDGLLADIASTVEDLPFDSATAEIETAPLCFYEDYVLCALESRATGENEAIYMLWSPGDAVLLDWTNGPIYSLNERAPIIVEDSTVVEYAKFFFGMIRGASGYFVIAEGEDDVQWLPEATDEQKQSVCAKLKPVVNLGLTEDNFYTLVGTVLFKDALFQTEIKIAPFPFTSTDPETGADMQFSTGQIALWNEELLQEDLPIEYDSE